MAKFYKVDESTKEIVNAEMWDNPPTVEGFYYISSDVLSAAIGDTLDDDNNIVPKPVVLVTVEEVREIRDELLRASDYTQIPDYPISDDKREEWKTYRQELRDITEGYTPVEEPEFPTKPE